MCCVWHSKLTDNGVQTMVYRQWCTDSGVQTVVCACACVQFKHGEHIVPMHIDLNSFKAVYVVNDPATSPQYNASIRRLSTPSYAEDGDLVAAGGGRTEKFVTQWRWFWQSGGFWLEFGEVTCCLCCIDITLGL